MELRLSQTHHLWHVITGSDTSVIGEISLQAFHLSQLPSLVEAIRVGLQMGLEARPLFAQRWQEDWGKPLQQCRDELELRPLAERLGRP